MKRILLISLILLSLAACKRKAQDHDASGSFEAVETIVPAEATGIIQQLQLEEGQSLNIGEIIGNIDSVQLFLKKKQLLAQIKSTMSMRPDINKQLAVTKEQLKTAETEQKRISNLLKSEAATPKQLDDINAQIEVLKKQMIAQQSTLGIQSESLSEQTNPLQVQIEQLNDQLAKCHIINKVKGTVLTKYAEVNEMAVAGKPLYKIADLSSLKLKAYISGDQFSQVKLNQPVKVLVDKEDGKIQEYDGTIEWINNKAEFTPKTIQTKDERANLVYAIKIHMKNDGYLKIGMYADVKF